MNVWEKNQSLMKNEVINVWEKCQNVTRIKSAIILRNTSQFYKNKVINWWEKSQNCMRINKWEKGLDFIRKKECFIEIKG